MVTKNEPQPKVKKPANLDIERGKKAAEKAIRENIAWLKEMAKR